MTTTKTLTADDLRQFAGGTEHWYRHGLVRDVLFTDGAKYVADTGGAYWLLDETHSPSAATQRSPRKRFRSGS